MESWNNPFNIPKNDADSRMSLAPNMPNFSFGNPFLDQISSMFLGGRVAPRPSAGQSIHEAFIQRERSYEFINAMRTSFAGSALTQKLGGINPSTMSGQALSSILGNPDGLINHPMARALNGGNPVQAQMGMLAGFTGMTYKAATGNTGSLTGAESNDMMRGVYSSLFNTHTFSKENAGEERRNAGERATESVIKTGKDKEAFKDILDSKGQIDMVKVDEIRRGATTHAREIQREYTKAYGEAWAKVIKENDSVKDINKLVGQMVPDSVKFEKTRGFEMQDLTKSYTMATDLNLFNASKYNRQNAGMSESQRREATTKQYFDNAGGVLRATADLTGDTTAEGSMSSLNQLLGNSAIDMGDKGDVAEVERLLRTLKGGARTAGISTEAMRGSIGDIRMLADQHEDLRYIGGTEAVKMGTSALANTYALQSTYGTKWTRQQGGTANVLQQQSQLEVANRTDIPAQEYKGLIGVIQNRTDLSNEQKSALRGQVGAYYNGKGTFSKVERGANFQKIASQLGMSGEMLRMQSQDTFSQQAGESAAQDLAKNGENIDYGAATQNVATEAIQRGLERRGRGDKAQIKDQAGNVMSPEARASAFKFAVGDRGRTGKTIAELITQYGYSGSAVAKNLLSDPNAMRNYEMSAAKDNLLTQDFVKNKNEFMRDTTSFAASDTETSKRLARLQVPIGQLLGQELMSGNFKKGASHLLGLLSDDPGRERMSKMLGSMKAMTQNSTAETIQAAGLETYGGGSSEGEARANLKKEHMSAENIEKTINQRREFVEHPKDKASYDIAGEKNLSMKQVLEAAKKGEGAGGLDKHDISRAAKYIRKTGFGSDENLEKYGDQRISDDVTKNIIKDRGAARYTDTLKSDMLDPLQKSTEDVVAKTSKTSEGAEALKAWQDAGFGDGKGGLNVNKAADEAFGGSLNESSGNIVEDAKNKRINERNDKLRKTKLAPALEQLHEQRAAVKAKTDEMKENASESGGAGGDGALEKMLGAAAGQISTALANIERQLQRVTTT